MFQHAIEFCNSLLAVTSKVMHYCITFAAYYAAVPLDTLRPALILLSILPFALSKNRVNPWEPVTCFPKVTRGNNYIYAYIMPEFLNNQQVFYNTIVNHGLQGKNTFQSSEIPVKPALSVVRILSFYD